MSAPTDWQAHSRVDVTFSLPASIAVSRACDRVRERLTALGCKGWTEYPVAGYWQGQPEPGQRFELIQPQAHHVQALIEVLHDEGCEAVQVEYHTAPGYSVREWRPTRGCDECEGCDAFRESGVPGDCGVTHDEQGRTPCVCGHWAEEHTR